MSTTIAHYEVVFPAGYDAQAEFETPSRGYLSDVVVRLEDGSRYSVTFFDPVRLQQDLAELVKWGKACLAEVNLVVLPEVTTASVRRAVSELVEDGYFQHLKPL